MKRKQKNLFIILTLTLLLALTSATLAATPTKPGMQQDVTVEEPTTTTATRRVFTFENGVWSVTEVEEEVAGAPNLDGRALASVEKSAMTASRVDSLEASGKEKTLAADIIPDSYIVMLRDAPVTSYQGGVAGLSATATGGGKLDINSPAVTAYRSYLLNRQNDYIQVVAKMQGETPAVEHQYTLAVNGFAVSMSRAEADLLAQVPGVLGVFPNRMLELNTDVSPAWIGATGIWDGTATPDVGTKGAGTIVGIFDTGINMDHPSFAGVGPVDGYVFPAPPGGFRGWCDPAHASYNPALVCNNKLIGVYSYPSSGNSPEDDNGHGSHVAGTAAGNTVMATLYGLTKEISGMAPHAHVIMYDVCTPAGCPTAASMAAIEDAIADQVDVVNFSIGSASPASYNPWASAEELAWLGMVNAGIMPVSSAGNNGPGASTVGYSIGPWQLDVANITHNRFLSSMRISVVGGPTELQNAGATEGDAAAFANTVNGTLRTAMAVDAGNNTACNAFPAGSFTGTIALVQRGGCTFSAKVNNAAAAGATGVVIYNSVPGTPIAMSTPGTTIPSIMVTIEVGTALNAYMASSDVPVLIERSTGYVVDASYGDILNAGSSRGPVSYPFFNVIKPDIGAPGTNVWAARHTTNPGDPDEYGLLSGTSMASPHVTGAYALMKAVHPTWSTQQIRSALQTTAKTDVLRDNGVTPANPFDIGSGRVNLYEAALAGLTLNETNFATANPATGGNPSQLNLPTLQNSVCLIGIGCTFNRTVQNVLDTPMTWDVTVMGAADVTVTPMQFTLNPGQTQVLLVEVDMDSGVAGQWYFGDVWLDPQDLDVPAQHLTLAVQAAIPLPKLEMDPLAFHFEMTADKVQADFTLMDIFNAGYAPLDWEIGEGQYVDYMYNNDQGGSTGLGSSYDLDTDAFSQMADDFTLDDQTEIVEIYANGFSNQRNLNTDALAIWFEVYADDGGVPGASIWDDFFFPGDPGLDLTGNTVRLDLPTAGATPLDLAPGKYWMSVQPILFQGGAYANGWFWYLGAEAKGSPAAFSTSGFSNLGTYPWTPLNLLSGTWHSLAMSLKGVTVNGGCPAPDEVDWVDFSDTSGTLPMQTGEYVQVVYDSTGLATGRYEQTLCMNSNDPDLPTQPFIVTLDVVDPDVPLACNAPTTRFVDGIPASWTVVDNGDGVVWDELAFYDFNFDNGLPFSNFTGGLGDAAMVSSDFHPVTDFDTELRSPAINVAGMDRVILTYKANYINYATDFLNLGVSTNGGTTWTTLLSWNEDHGGFLAAPGEDVKLTLEMADYDNPASIIFRWHYYDNFDNWAWYAQVDEVLVQCGSYPEILVTTGGNATPPDVNLPPSEPVWLWNATRRVHNLADATGLPLDWTLSNGTDLIKDGGFELGTPNPHWQEESPHGTLFNVPIISTDGALEGNWGTWFGGWGGWQFDELAYLTQNVVIPQSSVGAELSFWMLAGVCDSPSDYLKVIVDGNVEWEFYGDDAACGDGLWHQYTVDLSAYADGAMHEIAFHAADLGTNGGWSNFFVDEVSLFQGYPWITFRNAAGNAALSGGTTNPGTFTAFRAYADLLGMPSGMNTGYVTVNSNDPVYPQVSFPVNVLIIRPALDLQITVGLRNVCSTQNTLVLKAPTNVTYCYTVTNTGDGPLTSHFLTDSVWGTMFSNLPYALQAGESYTYKVTKLVSADTINTATWRGVNGSYVSSLGIYTVDTSDSASAQVSFKSSICVGPWCRVRVAAPALLPTHILMR